MDDAPSGPAAPHGIPPGYRLQNGELVPSAQPMTTSIGKQAGASTGGGTAVPGGLPGGAPGGGPVSMPGAPGGAPGAWPGGPPGAGVAGGAPPGGGGGDGADRPWWTSPPRQVWWVGAILLLLLGVLVVVRSGEHPAPRRPTDQRAFMSVVEHGQDRVRTGNPITVVSARLERDRRLCDVLGPRRQRVRQWIGTIHGIDTTGDDQGVITVSIGHDIDLRTGSGFGAAKRTLLHPRSEVFDAVADLDNGDVVSFAGVFVRSRGSCARETSLRARSGMLTPDFLFLFTSIKRA